MASHQLLHRLESLYPKSSSTAPTPWYIVAAAAFSASNLPEAVADVYIYINEGLKTDEEKMTVARKMRDGLFKAGMTGGYSKAINALAQLHKVTPEQYRDAEPIRTTSSTLPALASHGQEYFEQTYGDTATRVQPFLKDIYPDMEYFSTTIAYGYVYGDFAITTPVETSYAMVAALIAVDTPQQAAWHLGGAQRNGATLAEVRAVREIAILASKEAGVSWKNEIPEVVDVMSKN